MTLVARSHDVRRNHYCPRCRRTTVHLRVRTTDGRQRTSTRLYCVAGCGHHFQIRE